GFSCSGKSEENGCIARFALIRRAMHRQHTFFLWKDIVEQGENSFFDFARVTASANENDFFRQIQNGEVVLACSVNFRTGFKSWRTNDAPFRIEVLDFG